MNGIERKTSTVEVTSSLYELASTASLDKPEPYSGDRLEIAPVKRMSLIRALSMATILPFVRLDEEVFRNRGYGVIANRPYIALQEDQDDDEALTAILGFSLGAPRIIIPTHVALTSATLRALAAGKIIMKPLVLDFEE
jgi:hypothetical protein